MEIQGTAKKGVTAYNIRIVFVVSYLSLGKSLPVMRPGKPFNLQVPSKRPGSPVIGHVLVSHSAKRSFRLHMNRKCDKNLKTLNVFFTVLYILRNVVSS